MSFQLSYAQQQAFVLVQQMSPFCHRIEVAGSIRRDKPEVKDIEVVAIPKWGERPGPGLFADPEPFNLLHEWAIASPADHSVRWIKTGVPDPVDWVPKAEGKYWRGLMPDGMKLDLFLASPANWGAILLIRTGSADFSQAVVTHAKATGRPCKDGSFTLDGTPVETPEEADVFAFLRLAWVDPQGRTGPEAVRAAR